MTIDEMIQRVDETHPNALSNERKAAWLSELESRIRSEITGEPAGEGDDRLVVPASYESVYSLYLSAMISLHQADYDDYNNAISLFNNLYGDFVKYWRRTHGPAPAGGFRNVM